jgi:hypothetical protein
MQVMSDGRSASRLAFWLAFWLLAGLLVARGILEEVAVGALEPEAVGAGVLDEAPAAQPADTSVVARTSTAASAGRRLAGEDFMFASLPNW